MKTKNKRIDILENEKVPKALLKLGLPIMAGMIITAAYNVVDAYFVGKLGTSQMAAVSVVFPIGTVLLGIGLLFGAGAASYLSRLLGGKNYEEANRCASTALFSSLITGGIIIILSLIFLTPLLRLLGATETIMPFSKEYAVIFIAGLIINLFNITTNNIITAEGATNISMMAMGLGCILNIILDPILILALGLGVRGAAIATLISRSVTAVIYLFYILGSKSVFHFRFKHFTVKASLYSEILKMGMPMLIFQLLTSLSLSLTNSLASSFGDSAIAALGVVTRIMALWSMSIFGFLKGFTPFAGFNYGAGKMDRVKEAIKTSVVWSTIFCFIVSAIMIIFSRQIISWFAKSDPAAISIGTKALTANAITFLVFGFTAVYSNLFIGLGRAKEGGIISITRQGVFFIPTIFILKYAAGLNGMILTQPVADILTAILLVVLIKTSGVKKILNKSNT
ncbi:MAG: MATE family efflux transporter [Spirochaetales bacterium]|nr:MATE family efflux transporter [Spirochaetales bacterium]